MKKQRIFLLYLAVLLSVPALSWARESNSLALYQSNNKFGLNLLQSLPAEELENNVLISPLSAFMALGMTMQGAAGSTQEAMGEVLHVNHLSPSLIKSQTSHLLSQLKGNEEFQLELANSLWHEDNFRINSSFVKDLRAHYEAEIQALDFASPGAADRIDQWVSDKTHGKIGQIAPRPLADKGPLLLVNATYFKANWLQPFLGTSAPAPFHAPGSTMKIPYMTQSGSYRHLVNEDWEGIDLPYKGDAISMMVFIPRKEQSLTDLLREQSSEQMQKLFQQLAKTPYQGGTVWMPKFKFEFKTSLKNALTDMGMGEAFSPRANFSHISPDTSLMIDDVIQKTFISVDEHGTEAAAVTAVIIVRTSAGPRPQFLMNINRPFLFTLYDHRGGGVLFVGMVHQPNS